MGFYEPKVKLRVQNYVRIRISRCQYFRGYLFEFLDAIPIDHSRPIYEVEYTDKCEVIVIEAYEKYEDGLLSDAAKVCIPILLIFF